MQVKTVANTVMIQLRQCSNVWTFQYVLWALGLQNGTTLNMVTKERV